jgi:hypothetical protein
MTGSSNTNSFRHHVLPIRDQKEFIFRCLSFPKINDIFVNGLALGNLKNHGQLKLMILELGITIFNKGTPEKQIICFS